MTIAPTTPRLSQLTMGRRALDTCQSCGRFAGEQTDYGKKTNLSLWEECNDYDEPEGIYVVLCEACVKLWIEKHPRLYRGLSWNAPAPGAMQLCTGCAFHGIANLSCNHPDLKRNGGPGMAITMGERTMAFVDGIRRGRRTGWREVVWLTPPKACKGREAA